MIERPVDEMEITSTSLDLLSQAASLLNGTQLPRVSSYGSNVVSSSPPKDLQTKGQKVRRKKSTRREVLSSSSAVKIKVKKTQMPSNGDWEMCVDGYENAKSRVSSSLDHLQSPPPPPYPSSPSPPRNLVLPPYPSSYRGDPLTFPQNSSISLLKENNNNIYNAPLDMSKKSLQIEAVSKQHRPSVITCASSLQQHCHHQEERQSLPVVVVADEKNAEKEELLQGHRREVLSGMCDPVIDEHFRRSLGKDYSEIFASNTTPSVSVTVDDHFAKALGDTWLRLQQTKPIKDISPTSTTSSRQPVVQHAPGLITL